MWPTTYLKGGDGSSEEDQVHVSTQKRFRRQMSLVSHLFVYVLHLELCILHFHALRHSSHICSQVLCIPRLCVYAHCWSVKRIKDVWSLRSMFLKAPSYILHSALCVCALCMHFLSLQIYFSNFCKLHSTLCLCTFYLCIYLSSLQITFYILHFVFVQYVCTFCPYIFYLCRSIFLNFLSCILHYVYASISLCTMSIHFVIHFT